MILPTVMQGLVHQVGIFSLTYESLNNLHCKGSRQIYDVPSPASPYHVTHSKLTGLLPGAPSSPEPYHELFPQVRGCPRDARDRQVLEKPSTYHTLRDLHIVILNNLHLTVEAINNG